MTYRGIFVSETHWDREWYLSFHEFRKWLVKLIDDLIEYLPKSPDFHSFMLDGQTCVIEDYLEIRPQNREVLYKLIRDNRIIIGPFYVLADEFLESGEGIIRNLLLGHKIAQRIGVSPMKVGYVPDTFGHIWQLPQIFRGFGINSMYYYRGYPPLFGNHEEYIGKNENTPLEHWYASPDGSKTLTLHHITGYGNAAGITDGAQPKEEFPYLNGVFQIHDALKRVGSRTKSDLILLMNGSDHRQAEWLLPDLIRKWNANSELQEDCPIILEHGTLQQYFSELQKAIDHGLELPTLSGEARGSMYTQVTPGCISTRMNLKLLNWECSRELERYAEPFAVLSWLCGAQYQENFIEYAWKWLIQNHPHDSICGCSLDRVHADMVTRFYWALDNASDVSNYSCASILSGIDVEQLRNQARQQVGSQGKFAEVRILGIFNPHPFNGPFIIEDYIPLLQNFHYRLYDHTGKEITSYHLEFIPDFRKNVEQGQYLFKRFHGDFSLGKITALLNDIPACGYKIYYLIGLREKSKEFQQISVIPSPIKSLNCTISFNPNGSISIEDRRNQKIYKDVNLFEDGPDDGDEYDWAPLPKAKIFFSNDSVAIYHILNENSVFSEVEAEIPFSIPYELIGDIKVPRTRSQTMVSLQINTVYRIYKEYDRIDIRTKVTNKAKGHRLRVLFPSGIKASHSYADDHFMVMPRTIKSPRDDGWYQDMQGIYHQDTFVDLNDGKRGLAIFNRGICEFEAIETPPFLHQKGHSIALTLFRSVAWLSQGGHLGRKSGLNGPNLQTPGAQLMDHQFTFEYAIMPHIGSWEQAQIYRHAHAFNAPPRWFGERHHLRNEILPPKSVPFEQSYLKIDNPNIILSSIKRSERIGSSKDGIIFRVFNPTATDQHGKITLPNVITAIVQTNLLEEDEISIKMNTVNQEKNVEINVSPYRIMTFRLEFSRS